MGNMALNWSYTKTPTGLIQLGEIILAFIGGLLMAIFDGSGFWAFVFWSNVILTSLIIGLNLFEILPKLQMSFSYTDKVVSSQCLKIAQKVAFNIASEARFLDTQFCTQFFMEFAQL